MLGFFKTELFSTFDLNAYNHVKLVLKQAGIPYYVRSSNTTSNRSPHNLMSGLVTSIGPLDNKYAFHYRILVRKKDLDAATHALHQENRW